MASSTDDTVRTQRSIQARQDQRDEAKPASGKKSSKGGASKGEAAQAGAREHPQELPAQHVAKPGVEADLALRPQYLAPDYRGSGKLDGKKHPWRMELFQALQKRQDADGGWRNQTDKTFQEDNADLASAFAILSLSYCKAAGK